MGGRSISRTPKSDHVDPALADALEQLGLPAGEDAAGVLADAPRIRTLLIEAAREGEPVSYSAMLARLGLRFSRPKMRALCRTMDAVDRGGRERGEPGLAVLVVRESDGLPGQGWWLGHAEREEYAGEWTGPAARAVVARAQRRAMDHWRNRS